MLTWKQRVIDLQNTGLTQAKIAELCEMKTASVSDLARGITKSPNGDAALRLHALHLERCPQSSTAA